MLSSLQSLRPSGYCSDVCILRLYKVIGTQPRPLLWLAEMGELGRGWSLCSEESQTEEPVRNIVGPLLMGV